MRQWKGVFLHNNLKWILVLCLSACVLFVALVVGIVDNREKEVKQRRTIPRLRTIAPDRSPEDIKKRVSEAKSYVPPDPLDKHRESIADHFQRIEEEPDSVEAPALLHAAGNLYGLKLGDWKQAAWCYEEVLSRYPDYVGKNTVYPALVRAYESLDDNENLIRIAMRIMDVFPENTPEHDWAKVKLGMSKIEGPVPGSIEEAELVRQQAAEMAVLQAEAAADEEENLTEGGEGAPE